MVDCSVSCISCGMCAKVCPVQAITMREDANGSLRLSTTANVSNAVFVFRNVRVIACIN